MKMRLLWQFWILLFLRKDLARTEITKRTKSTKSTKTQPSKITKRYKPAVRVWWSHIRTKTSFLVPFKKLFWIKKSKIVLMTSFILLHVSLLIFHSGLEDLSILQCISEAPISHCSNPSLQPDSYITFEQYFNVVWLCQWKIDIRGRT